MLVRINLPQYWFLFIYFPSPSFRTAHCIYMYVCLFHPLFFLFFSSSSTAEGPPQVGQGFPPYRPLILFSMRIPTPPPLSPQSKKKEKKKNPDEQELTCRLGLALRNFRHLQIYNEGYFYNSQNMELHHITCKLQAPIIRVLPYLYDIISRVYPHAHTQDITLKNSIFDVIFRFGRGTWQQILLKCIFPQYYYHHFSVVWCYCIYILFPLVISFYFFNGGKGVGFHPFVYVSFDDIIMQHTFHTVIFSWHQSRQSNFISDRKCKSARNP